MDLKDGSFATSRRITHGPHCTSVHLLEYINLLINPNVATEPAIIAIMTADSIINSIQYKYNIINLEGQNRFMQSYIPVQIC